MAAGYESKPGGMAAIVQQLADLQRQVNELRSAAGIRSAVITEGGLTIKGGGSLTVTGGGDVVVDPDGAIRSSDFDGDLAARDPGTVGWAIDHASAAFADLLLRPGSVGNDALAAPIGVGGIFKSATNFGLSPYPLQNLVVSTLTVPAGFTSAAVSVLGRVFASNTTAAADDLYGVVDIATLNGYSLPENIKAGGYGANVSGYSTVLTGLTPGGSFDVILSGGTNTAAWAARNTNTAEISGLVLWFR